MVWSGCTQNELERACRKIWPDIDNVAGMVAKAVPEMGGRGRQRAGWKEGGRKSWRIICPITLV